MSCRIHRILFLVAFAWLCWLGMTLVHEAGHAIGATITGGTVRQVVWHPAVLSRTDVSPNPWPRVEVWAGAIVGCAGPLLLAAASARWRGRFVLAAFAGFCLIANGAYLGVGAFDPVGDARELIALGTSRWTLATFGCCAVIGGLWLWHDALPCLGVGRGAVGVRPMQAWACVGIAVVVTAIGWLVGNQG